MRLVEVVVLMGAHCISPVEHSPLMTDAGKVQCAIVIEKDTDKGTVKVTPETAATDPKVIAAIAQFDARAAAAGTKIVPAFAPAGSPKTEIKLPPLAPNPAAEANPALQQPEQVAGTQNEAAVDAAAEPPAARPDQPAGSMAAEVADTTTTSAPAARKVVKLAQTEPKAQSAEKPARTKEPPRKQVADASPKPSGQCKGSAVPKWYKTADGHKKFRCVRPVPTSDQPPAQLY